MADPPARASLQDVFVGRQTLIDDLLARLDEEDTCFADALGFWGAGKTHLLRRLRHDARRTVQGCVVLDHSSTLLGRLPSPGEPLPPDPTAGISVRRYCEFLTRVRADVLEQCGNGRREKRWFEDFQTAVLALDQTSAAFAITIENNLRAGSGARISGQVQTSNVVLTGEAMEAQLDAGRFRVTQRFAEGLNEVANSRPVLWTIDDFDAIAVRRAGAWIMDLVGALEGALVVVARTPAVPEPSPVCETVLRRALPPLTRDEVGSYLERSIPGPAPSPEVVDAVDAFTGGHPRTLALVAEFLLARPNQAADLDEVRAVLRTFPTDPEDRQLELVKAIVAPDERAVLEGCAVVRRFDADLIRAIVGDEQGGRDTGAILEGLERRTFVERHMDAGLPGEGIFRLPEFLRARIAEELRLTEPRRYTTLHRAAADAYYRLLADYDEDEDVDRKDYSGWYRFEDPRWQRYEREWLYHEGQADRAQGGERRRRRSHLRLARVFLDAFWWWGAYVEFPFCRSLLRDWENTQDDVDWVRDLRVVLDRYPTGAHKSRASGWPDVEAALRRLRDACGLGTRNPDRLADEDERHTRGLIDLFLAHAARYGTPTGDADAQARYRRARALYTEADALFEADDDAWNRAWTRFELAELDGEHGAGDLAKEGWRTAADLIRRNRIEDEELTACLHRAAADMAWRNGDRLGAFAAHARALVHAYLFQNRPHPPDAYTLAFYEEQLDRAAQRLVQLWDGPARALTGAAAAELGAAFDPMSGARLPELESALAAGERNRIAALLVPRGPQAGELLAPRSPFVDEWHARVDSLDPAFDDDLWLLGEPPA